MLENFLLKFTKILTNLFEKPLLRKSENEETEFGMEKVISNG